MNIVINDQQTQIPDNSTITNALDHLSLATDGLAIAVNSDVVPRPQWSSHLLRDQDTVIIIRPVQGG